MILAEKQRISENLHNTTRPALQPRVYRLNKLKPFLTIVGLFFCVTIVNLWVQVAIVKQNDEIKNRQEAIRTLERESIKIRIEMANLDSFERIQTIAKRELKMRVAGPNDYRWIAAAPSLHNDEPRPYNYTTKTAPQNTHILSKLASWFVGFRTAMAQSN